jgi:hypothetical protein
MFDCVEDGVKLKLQEDCEEAEKIKKQKASIIIHGLRVNRVGASQETVIMKKIVSLLHKINFDSIMLCDTSVWCIVHTADIKVNTAVNEVSQAL